VSTDQGNSTGQEILTAAEQALIGAAITNAAVILTDPLIGRLTATHFTHKHHQVLWTALLHRYTTDQLITEIFIASDLMEAGQLGQLPGGAGYLHTCMRWYATPEQAHKYAQLMLQAAADRAAESHAARLVDLLAITDRPRRRALVLDELAALAEAVAMESTNGAGDDHGRVRFTALSMIGVRTTRWTWDRRAPAGAITLLAGREGIGKSTAMSWLTARLTRGELPGQHRGAPRGVAIVATEDAYAEVITPRMIAAGADLTRVWRVDVADELASISVPADLPGLAHLCAAHDIALVGIDPLMSVIHASLDTHKDREVRQALDPLARFAQNADVAVVGLIHTNKSPTTDPLNSLMGSRAFSASARSVLYAVVDPTAEREDRYLLGHPKSNNGPKQATLTYHLIEAKVEAVDPDGQPVTATTSRLIFDGEDERSIRDVLEAGHTPRERPTSEEGQAILDWIEDQGRMVATAEIIAAFPDLRSIRVRQFLTRFVDRGKLDRPFHGHYVLTPPHGTIGTTGTIGVVGTTGTISKITEVPVVPEAPAVCVEHPVEHLVEQSEMPNMPESETTTDPWNRPRCSQCRATLLNPGDPDPCRFCEMTT
jgi:AAA domain-containing protein/DnaB helicase-like protein